MKQMENINVGVYNKELADKYAEELKNQVDLRIEEMKFSRKSSEFYVLRANRHTIDLVQ